MEDEHTNSIKIQSGIIQLDDFIIDDPRIISYLLELKNKNEFNSSQIHDKLIRLLHLGCIADNSTTEDTLLKFSQHIQNDCIGVIDMTNSTKLSAGLSEDALTQLYEVFLNFMAKIVRKYDGEVIKNIGDALMFRFSNIDPNDSIMMKNILECGLSMIDSHDELAKQLKEKNLPELDYKISMTYGSVKVAQSTTSNIVDVFGNTVNRCFKINGLCPKNSLVVGINLYEILKDFSDYEFIQFCSIEIKQKYGYEVFEVKRQN
ncbi:MAG: adenylate/guanylate cyclase domain-containing protein [Nitrosopumilus sp.]|nr:adenylate/guanylate cyclase domain-containing protein [Nitrosopumilus sp.]MDH3515451.1 adenylate/guanylate cyclase domain-containing protein [Nitrosopumilus sp.]MDH3564249.1 adenylate/guanylate cyclase domain-containing protein [Nitrosopumilus sp.]MDH5416595.1 adenylate/guanylate cyclase domain-containing protein [Nitrosopumilus sp.]MDH5555138.1 adenylate/guanylate cyclase domain-containing protein [Nitrosopumilus sp.]